MVLEVGTGTGSLTTALAAQAGAVLSVEIDANFQVIVAETLGHLAHVQIIHGDILKNKNLLNPVIMEKLRTGLDALAAGVSSWSPICRTWWRRRSSLICCLPIYRSSAWS